MFQDVILVNPSGKSDSKQSISDFSLSGVLAFEYLIDSL